MSTQPGWIGLLASVGKRFEELGSGNVTLTLYVAPSDKPFPSNMPPRLLEEMQQQIVSRGTLPAGCLHVDYSNYFLLANPLAPNPAFFNHQVEYCRRFRELANDAWAILPIEIRRCAVGASDMTGWMVVVFRVFMNCQIGSVGWGPDLASIEGDLAKASALAIRAFEQRGVGAIVPGLPQNAAELLNWLTRRAECFRGWLADRNKPFYLPYVHDINDIFGPPWPGRQDVLHAWVASAQPHFVDYLITTAHRLLEEWGISDAPPWSSGPIDEAWIARSDGHLTALLSFLREKINPPNKSGKPRLRNEEPKKRERKSRSKKKVKPLSKLEATVKELRDERLPDGTQRTFGQIADELNRRGFTKRGGAPHDYHSAKAAYHHAAAKN